MTSVTRPDVPDSNGSSLTRRTLLAGGTGLAAMTVLGLTGEPARAAFPATGGQAVRRVKGGRRYQLPSRPETVHWGFFDASLEPVLTVQPGDVVTVDTLSHQGMINGTDPVSFFTSYGIRAESVLQDAIDVYDLQGGPKPGGSVHVMTGPIHVTGAKPGDVLEVRVLDSHPRVPYGVNRTGPGSGVLPELLTESSTMVIPLDLHRGLARVAPGVEVPIEAFQGIMTVAPPADQGMVSSRPPGPWGGNMDLRDLGAGCTLYLPVFNDGALFSTGDGHTAQGDGEVDGTAIETSLTSTLQFFLHRGVAASWPGAETKTHFITMGIDTDLETALAIALQQAVDFLQDRIGLTAAQAYTLCSVAVDFEIAEAVNYTKVVHGKIPKSVFKRPATYWAK